MKTALLILAAALSSPAALAGNFPSNKDSLEACLKRAEKVYEKQIEKILAEEPTDEMRKALGQHAAVKLMEKENACRHKFKRSAAAGEREWSCAEDVECQQGKIDAAMSAQ